MASMQVTDLTGKWAGRVVGTNVGNLLIEFHQEGRNINGTCRFNDWQYGLAIYKFSGRIDDRIHLALTPESAPEGVPLGPATAVASIEQDGSLVGDWESESGTAGTFQVYRQASATVPGGKSVARLATSSLEASATSLDVSLLSVQGGERQRRIPTCYVDHTSLRRIFRALKEASDEAVQLEISAIRNNPQLLGTLSDPARTSSLHAEHEARVKTLNAVGIILQAANGERVIGFDESLLEPDRLPTPLVSASLETGLLYRTSQPGQVAPNRAVVQFDFSKPPLIDLSNPSGAPTPNGSMLLVAGTNTTWVSGTYSKLEGILSRNRNNWGWLHGSHIYDFLLFIVGLPVALSAGSLVADWPLAMSMHSTLRTALIVYSFFVALYGFRLAFSLTRWLYPHVELRHEPKPFYLRLRATIVIVLLGALGSLIASGLIKLFGGMP
jgi:hypothetical protein